MMIARVAMFISSYIPLYALLVAKYAADAFWGESGWNVFGNVVATVLIIASVITGVLLWVIASRAHAAVNRGADAGHGRLKIRIESITASTTPDLLNYLALYFMPCLNMSVARVSDAIVMLMVMVVVGFVYLKERVTYLNPVLLLYGYRSYGCIVSEANMDASCASGAFGEAHFETLMRKGADPLLAGHSYDGKRFHDFVMVA